MAAAEGGNAVLASLLLENGAKANVRDDQGEIALTHAARGGWVKAVNLLGRFSDTKEKNWALFAAVEGGPVVVKIVDVPIQPAPPQSQLPIPEESWTSTVESLLNDGAQIESTNEDGSTPLMLAAKFAQTEIVKLLIRRGARIDLRDKYGNTPLILAACECAVATMNSAYDVAKILLDQGTDVNAHSKDGTTALMNAAAGFGDAAIVEMLLNSGADPRMKDRQGNSALTLAHQKQREDKVRLIKEALARAN